MLPRVAYPLLYTPSHPSGYAGYPSHDNKAAQAILQRHHVQVLGSGQRPLLFCSGVNCTQQVWHYLTPALATQHQLILFDQMGVGQSDRTAYDSLKYASLEGFAQNIVAICQALALSHELEQCAAQADPQLARQLVQLVLLDDFRPQLPQVPVPTLLL